MLVLYGAFFYIMAVINRVVVISLKDQHPFWMIVIMLLFFAMIFYFTGIILSVVKKIAKDNLGKPLPFYELQKDKKYRVERNIDNGAYFLISDKNGKKKIVNLIPLGLTDFKEKETFVWEDIPFITSKEGFVIPYNPQ
ncbi:MAG: hypothetical protein COU71_02475 [Parcubacteria group bacterium CG10_big_fil_rev_8_21_14_0_10_38_31]|nr:MAG: hypothetical protein COU71_02475 [Parcubacteria group bacterium CG10_big_fil_rev_8_21_14_0_10_38_31]